MSDSKRTIKPLGNWPEILEDSDWETNRGTSIPSRGIHDFDRTVKFASKPTPEQLRLLSFFFAKDHCPGWTGVNPCRTKDETTFQFRTTWDSSD